MAVRHYLKKAYGHGDESTNGKKTAPPLRTDGIQKRSGGSLI